MSFSTWKAFGPDKCPVYLKIPYIGNISAIFESRIKKGPTNYFSTVQSLVVYRSRAMLPSIQKDGVPANHKVLVFLIFVLM